MSMTNVDKLFDPKSIAIIGASNRKDSVGYILLRNILAAEYEGIVYPVNQHERAVQAIHCYASISQVPRKVDLAIVAVPAGSVPDVVRECGENGVNACVIVSAGFKEVGAEGKALEDQVMSIARSHGLRILGPNCLGFSRPSRHINATFAHLMPEPGSIAFLSQSGALGTAILDWAKGSQVGFSAFVSVGSMSDVDFGDLIDYFGADPNTRSMMVFMESVTDARKFMSAARHFAMTKPIVVIKAGRTPRTALAAGWHTGAVAGEDGLYDAAFRRAGIVRVGTIEDLFNASEVLSRQTSPRGPRLAILTNAGGPAVMAADELISCGGQLADISPETDKLLRVTLPGYAARGNPVDIGGDADEERYAAAARALMDDATVDGLLVILTPQAMTHPQRTARGLIEVARQHSTKPMLTSFMGLSMTAEAVDIFNTSHIPTFNTPEAAVRAYAHMLQYSRNLALIYETPQDILPSFRPDRETVKAMFARLARDGISQLTGIESKEVLKAYKIGATVPTFAATPAEAAAATAKMGLPVAMKVVSRDVTLESTVRGVALNIRSAEEATAQFTEICERARAATPDAEILGVSVEPMVRKDGYELLLSSRFDPTFGPVLAFGLSGPFRKLYRDVSFGYPPLNEALARAMIRETRVSVALEQQRAGDGGKAMVSLEQTLVKLSYLLVEFPEIVQVNIDPLYVGSGAATALDADLVIDPTQVHKVALPGSHLVISMYPTKYESQCHITGEKDAVTMRPIRPEDEPLWTAMINSLSESTVQYRFFGSLRQITKAMIIRYCHVDYDREIAIVAIHGTGRHRLMLGVVRLTKDARDSEEGEFAIVIRDEYQGRGLGGQLMDALVRAARDQHVHVIWGDVLAANSGMVRFAESLGFDVRPTEDPEVRKILLRI
jgi:acetyltransferase